MYTSVLQTKEASVAVHMHVRVCNHEALRTKLWIVEVIDSDDHTLNLRMVPASVHATTTCKELKLVQYGGNLFVEFVPNERVVTSTLLFARRHLRATREAHKRAAC